MSRRLTLALAVLALTLAAATPQAFKAGYRHEARGGLEVRVEPAPGGKHDELHVGNKLLELGMDMNSACWTTSLRGKVGNAKNMLPNLYFQLGETYEYHGAVKVEDMAVREGNGSLVCVIKQSWPKAEVVKTVAAFEGKPYLLLRYDVEVAEDSPAQMSLVRFLTDQSLDRLCWSEGGDAVWRRHAFPKEANSWFSVPKAERDRWVVFQNGKTGEGFAIVGADVRKWAELPPRFYCCEMRGGGYSIGFDQGGKQELRKGDKISFAFFLLVFEKDAVERTREALRQLAGGL